jgi:uncharacterized membrane protein YbhN (UPF0104 family)
MTVFQTLKEEVAKTPIGTVGSICGVITLVMDIVHPGTWDAHSGMTWPEQFAVTTLKAVVISFIFTFVPARFLDADRRSSKVLYIILGFIAALLINGQYRTYFFGVGGWGNVVMYLPGFLLAALYAAIYLETLRLNPKQQRSLTGVEKGSMLFVAVIQVLIISFDISLPVLEVRSR